MFPWSHRLAGFLEHKEYVTFEGLERVLVRGYKPAPMVQKLHATYDLQKYAKEHLDRNPVSRECTCTRGLVDARHLTAISH